MPATSSGPTNVFMFPSFNAGKFRFLLAQKSFKAAISSVSRASIICGNVFIVQGSSMIEPMIDRTSPCDFTGYTLQCEEGPMMAILRAIVPWLHHLYSQE